MFELAKETDIQDEDLMINFQNGDSSAFDLLLDRYCSRILFFIMKKLNLPKASAEDLMQEVFTRVIEKRNSYDPLKKFSVWLYTVANNRCIDYIRVESKRRVSSLDSQIAPSESDVTHLELVKSKDKHPDEISYNNEIKTQINAALNTLKDELKEVFLLREIEGLSLNEISEITGTPLNTVKTRLRTAYLNIRHFLVERSNIIDTHGMESNN